MEKRLEEDVNHKTIFQKKKKLHCDAASVQNFSSGVTAKIKKKKFNLVYNKNTKCNFLIDLGSGVSFVPASINVNTYYDILKTFCMPQITLKYLPMVEKYSTLN